MLTAAIGNVIWFGLGLIKIIDFKVIFRFMWAISPLPYFGVAAAFGDSTAAANALITLFLLAMFMSVVGAIFSLRRIKWRLSLAGSVGALFCFPILGMAAIVLTLAPEQDKR